MSKYIPTNIVADYNIKVQQAKALLGFSPTSDIQEVRHGEWQEVTYYKSMGSGKSTLFRAKRCSICNGDSRIKNNYKFCPHCGAKMDGERKEQ